MEPEHYGRAIHNAYLKGNVEFLEHMVVEGHLSKLSFDSYLESIIKRNAEVRCNPNKGKGLSKYLLIG